MPLESRRRDSAGLHHFDFQSMAYAKFPHQERCIDKWIRNAVFRESTDKQAMHKFARLCELKYSKIPYSQLELDDVARLHHYSAAAGAGLQRLQRLTVKRCAPALRILGGRPRRHARALSARPRNHVHPVIGEAQALCGKRR
jgi:hypothetical protein